MEVEAVGRVNFAFCPHYIQQEKITKERILMNNKKYIYVSYKRRESHTEMSYGKLKNVSEI